ncbi:hypothetical protein [Natronomonas sp. EA1]|uniref:hypothetical protein n=1 Tax=Natronomonas sp. EA1 TaxID=3421655 RepID=UPI003EBF46B3
MSDSEGTEIVDLDAEAVLDAARAATDGTLHTLIEFDRERFEILYVHESTRALYASDEEMREHFASIHEFVNLDFAEVELFTEDLLPFVDRVRYKTTAMDTATFVRLYVSESTGLFITLDPGAEAEPVARAIEGTIER